MCMFGATLPRVISEPGRGLWDDRRDYVWRLERASAVAKMQGRGRVT